MPISDPRFLAVTVEEMLTDYYAHLYYDNPKELEAIEDDDFNPDDVAALIGAPQQPGGTDDWEDL